MVAGVSQVRFGFEKVRVVYFLAWGYQESGGFEWLDWISRLESCLVDWPRD